MKKMQDHKITSKEIEIEITEGALVENVDDIIVKINELKKEGFKILIDDFGTGYSSLSYLNQFDIDVLKIDRSFIKDYPQQSSGTIAAAISDLAHNLKMDLVAEGVETTEQIQYLASHGCYIIQGYYYSKPLTTNDYEEVLKKGKLDPASK